MLRAVLWVCLQGERELCVRERDRKRGGSIGWERTIGDTCSSPFQYGPLSLPLFYAPFFSLLRMCVFHCAVYLTDCEEPKSCLARRRFPPLAAPPWPLFPPLRPLHRSALCILLLPPQLADAVCFESERHTCCLFSLFANSLFTTLFSVQTLSSLQHTPTYIMPPLVHLDC